MQSGIGRKLFSRFGRVIAAASRVAALFPMWIRTLLWDVSNPFGGRFACGLRYVLLRSMSKQIGDNVYIGQNVRLLNCQNLSVGSNVSIHSNCYLDAAGGCLIGDNVSIAHASSILTFEHAWKDLDLPIKYNPTRLSPVTIESDCWIGCGVRIMSGVRVGGRSVIAAGAVVTSDVEQGSLVGGVPARLLKRIHSKAHTELGL